MAQTTNCKQCNTLVYEDEQIDGYGLRCGCLKQYVMHLKKNKQTVQLELFNNNKDDS